MRSTLRAALALPVSGLLLAVVLAGCQRVREDRSITFSKDGDAVGFQHGPEGVYVAGKDGGPPVKVFEPGPDVAAVSTPLWNPKDRRLLFTTAKAKDGPKRPTGPFAEQNPAGQVFGQQAVTYTCWLREEPKGDEAPKPVPLFEVACDHVGYVAANLAVRWHPDGDRILYVKQTTAGAHGLFEYDLNTKTSRQLFPHTAAALVFDWTPDGSHLVCVIGSVHNERDGVWVGKSDGTDWWHVEESRHLAQGEFGSLLERLKATRPVWTKDGARFAFVTTLPKQDDKQPDHHVLRLGTLGEPRTRLVAEGPEPFRDLHWAPDGTRLGLVRGNDPGSLHMLGADEVLSGPVNKQPVRQFAGWSASGEQLAYTVPDKLPYADEEHWAFLLLPDRLARDAVYVSPGSGADPGHEVFSGMRVTFPNWSPKEEKLSLWFTFSPTYRFLLFALFGGGLFWGDPAAVFDVQTGNVGWMAVTPFEKAQIGHYHLLKRDYAAALARYQEAGREAPAPQRPTLEEFFRSAPSPRHVGFFEAYCLEKLGRKADAQAKRNEFRRTFLPEWPKPGEPVGDFARSIAPWFHEQREFWEPLLTDAYMTEVFLSLDAAEDGCRFFEAELKKAKSDADRLASALMLSQLLLLRDKGADYAELTTDTVAPLLLQTWRPETAKVRLRGLFPDQNGPLLLVAGLAVAPLQSPDFLARLPREKVQALVPRWTALREKAPDDVTRLGIDLVLHAAYKSLDQAKERQAVAQRIEGNPTRAELLPKEGFEDPWKDFRKAMEELLSQLRALRAALAR